MTGIDFDGRDFFTDNALLAEPYEYLAAMRDKCPVLRENHHEVVMVTGYEESLAVYNDADRFSSCISVTGPFPGFPVPLEGDDISELITEHRDQLPMNDQLPTMDPPTHTQHRGLLTKMITPIRLRENEEFMQGLCALQYDAALGPDGKTEFIGQFAGPFVLLVIADLLGVPEADHQEFVQAMLHGAAGSIGSSKGETLKQTPLEFLYGRFSTYIEERRREPRKDVLTGLAQATFPDGSLPEVIDVVRVAANLFAAGQETTIRLLSSAVRILAEDQDLQARLRADRSLLRNFIEEVLRYESPVRGDFRLSKVPVDVGGVELPAGTTLMLLNAAANRDPRQFADPEVFDVDRENARFHFAFGRGAHICPGAALARTEARISLGQLLDRTTGIRIDEDFHGPATDRKYHYIPTFILRGLTRLHIRYTLT
ncbi:MAG TPA: cytochrome P450 [Trebonia sp.]|nr:cytochrome P450 [Trebonia sp.]